MSVKVQQISFLMPTLVEQCGPRQPLRKLADKLSRQTFEEPFGEFYSEEGSPPNASA